MPAYDQNNRRDIARSPRQTWGTSASAPTTINMRHHTSGNAESVSSLPRMAVKPQSSTQAWICRKALRVSVSGMHRLSPLDWTTGNPFAAGLALCFETIEAMTPWSGGHRNRIMAWRQLNENAQGVGETTGAPLFNASSQLFSCSWYARSGCPEGVSGSESSELLASVISWLIEPPNGA